MELRNVIVVLDPGDGEGDGQAQGEDLAYVVSAVSQGSGGFCGPGGIFGVEVGSRPAGPRIGVSRAVSEGEHCSVGDGLKKSTSVCDGSSSLGWSTFACAAEGGSRPLFEVGEKSGAEGGGGIEEVGKGVHQHAWVGSPA